jgi:hypothetical protein
MIKKLHNLKHRMIVRILAVLTGAALVMATLSGCGASDDDCKGDPGRITEKDEDSSYNKSSKTTTYDYDITVLRADNTTYEKDISETAYDDWYKVGGKFPHPTKCEDGKAK